jgi:hypothetical protein
MQQVNLFSLAQMYYFPLVDIHPDRFLLHAAFLSCSFFSDFLSVGREMKPI